MTTPPPADEPPLEARLDSFLKKTAQQNKRAARARRPYYTLLHGQSVAKIVEKIIEDPMTIQRIPGYGVQVSTIRQQFYQGLDYAIDHLDHAERYLKASQQITTKIIDGYLCIQNAGRHTVPLASAPHINHRNNLENFIETSVPGDKYPDEVVALSDADVAALNSLMVGLESIFQYYINNTTIRVIRVA